jgi:secretion/DNA translocation related CpaE-like protein
MSAQEHRRIGVVGASGGLGASTLTASLALRAARAPGGAVCVDADLTGGGIDVTVGVEHEPGLRWGDLGGVDGPIAGGELLAALPRQADCPVLAAGVSAGDVRLPAVMTVLDALAGACAVTVIDLPRHAGHRQAVAEWCDVVVLLCGMSVRGLADGEVVAGGLVEQERDTRLVLRCGPRRGHLAEAVAAHLDLPLLGRLPDDPGIASDADRGHPPGERDRSPLAAVSDQILGELTGDRLMAAEVRQ